MKPEDEQAEQPLPAGDGGPTPGPQADLAEALRNILLAADRKRVAGLEVMLDDLEARLGDEEALASMVAPVLGDAIRRQIRDAREEMVESLYPIIGQVVVRAVSEAIRDLARSVDAQMRESFSLPGTWRRWRARMGGVSGADMVLRASLPFEVAEIFLIHRETGLLLRHIGRDAEDSGDSDLVGGMLTAIRDFARDAFGRGQEGQLDEIQYGDRRILIEAAQHAYLAVVADGVEPPGFRAAMRERIIEVEHAHEKVLRRYDGDAAPLAAAEKPLRSLMAPAAPAGLSRGQKRLLAGAAALAATCILLSCATGAWAWQVFRATPVPVIVQVPAPTWTPEPSLTPTAVPTPTATDTPTPQPTQTAVPTRTPTLAPTATPLQGVMTGDHWIHAGPSADSARLGMVVQRDQPVEIRAVYGDWYQVSWTPEAQSQVVGWVQSRWVRAGGPIPAQIVTPAATP